MREGDIMLQAIYTNQDDQVLIKLQNEEKIAPLSTTLEVLFALCLQYGATYEGRRSATIKILNVKQKVPILLSKQILLFPTHSPKQKECVWVNYYAIASIERYHHETLILLNDTSKLIVKSSIRSIKEQIKRCFTYDLYLTQQEQSN